MSVRIAGPQIPGVNPNQPFPLPGGLEASLFPENSRYHGLKTLTHTQDNGKQVAYVERRFLPDPEELAEVREHTVAQGDRLDNLAYHYLGDPELAWRIADANVALDPAALTKAIGNKLRITLPAGFQGAPRA